MSNSKRIRRASNAGFLVQQSGNRISDGVHDARITRAIVMKPPERLSVYLNTTTGHKFRFDLELDGSQNAGREFARLQTTTGVHRPNDSTQFEGAIVGMRFHRGHFVRFEAISPPMTTFRFPSADKAGEVSDSNNKEVGE